MHASPGKAATLAFALAALLSPALLAEESSSEAQRLFQEGRYEAARLSALATLAQDPKNNEASVALVFSLLALERPADAENYALKAWALHKDPRLAEALGEALFAQGRNAEALAHFQSYVSSLPEGGRVGAAYYHMGEIFLRTARYGHADIAFSAALRHEPGNARWWARLGWAREKCNDPANALRAYDEALRLDPRLEDALLGSRRARAAIR